MAQTYGIVYQVCPPYEVLYTKWLSYGDIIRLKRVEEMVELYYNSNQFTHLIPVLQSRFENPFAMYDNCLLYTSWSEQCAEQVIPYFIGIGTVMEESYDNKYRIGVYGSRNICQKVCSLTKAESSFVADMSTGYSGNLG